MSSVGSKVGTGNGPFALVGNSAVGRRACYNQVTGVKRYFNDIQPKDIGVSAVTGFVYMGYVTCPYPNAIITKIDTSAAEAAGAVTLSGADTEYLPGYNYYATSGNRTRGPLPYPQVRAAGSAVVAVGAASPDAVNDAINLVKVEYQPLPYVFDAEEALLPGAPQLWPGGNSPGGTITNSIAAPATSYMKIGNAEAAIAEADTVVTLPVLDTQWGQHMELDTRGALVQWSSTSSSTSAPGASGSTILTLWSNSQNVYGFQTTLSTYFMIPAANINCKTNLGGNDATTGGCIDGGAFGNKLSAEEIVIAAAMARKSGGVVKFAQTRFGQHRFTVARFPFRAYVTIAAKNGLLTAIKAVEYSNCGAVAGSESELSEFYAVYNVPNVDLTSYPVNTNAYYEAAAMRDVGESQCSFFTETAVDMLAEKLNIDPAQFRLNNMRTAAYTDPATGTIYPDTAFDPSTGYPFSGFGQPACHLKSTAAFNWSGRWKGWGVPSGTPVNSAETQGTGQKLRGVGISLLSGAKGSLSTPQSTYITVTPAGVITVYSGVMDHGAGGNTAIPIIAAECLGMTPATFPNLQVVMSDTTLAPTCGSTGGSTGTRKGLSAVLAAQNLASQWFPTVAAALAKGTSAANLAFGNNTIYDTTNPSNSMSLTAAAALLKATITGTGSVTAPAKTAYRVGGTKICEVEIDVETADVRVINAVAGIGLGRVIFPLGAEGQVQGGFIGEGIGESFYEEMINDSSTGLKYSGSYLNGDYLDFKVPTIMQAPDTVQAVYQEYVDPWGPFGAVGIGENCLTGVIPCILNAMSNALGGYRFTRTPVRKEDIVAALQWMKANGKLPT